MMTPKPTASMSAAAINRELDKLSALSSKVTDMLIDAGRGNERHSEIVVKADPLSLQYKAISDRLGSLRNETERRYGPNAPSRLPRGFGPVRAI